PRAFSGRRLTTSRHIVVVVWYCAFRRTVRTPSTRATVSTTAYAKRLLAAAVDGRAPAPDPTTNNATSGARGRYMRCSAARSLIGITLELGAIKRKKAAPKNPRAGRLRNVDTTSASKATIASAGSAIATASFATGQA